MPYRNSLKLAVPSNMLCPALAEPGFLVSHPNLKLARMLVESAGNLFVSLHLNAHSHTQSMLASLLGGFDFDLALAILNSQFS